MGLRESPICGPAGEKILVAEPAYRSAGGGRRFAGLHAPQIGPNAALLGNRPRLVARSRAAYRNDPVFGGGVETRVANHVGTGIQPRPRLRAEDEPFREVLMDAWEEFSEECDADNQQTDFYGLTWEMWREVTVGGECFPRFRERPDSDGLAIGLQIQLIQGEQVPAEKNDVDPTTGWTTRGGITTDGVGRRRYVWMHRHHPTDVLSLGTEPVPVPWDDLLHLYVRTQPGLMRGEPINTRLALELHGVDGVNDATLQRLLVSSLYNVAIETPDAGTDRSPLAELEALNDETESRVLEPGMLIELRPGEKLATAQPPDVGAGYEGHMKARMRRVARGLGLTYEQLTGDYSDSTYSSGRMGRLEMQRESLCLMYHVIVHGWCRPVWKRFVQRALIRDRRRLGRAARAAYDAMATAYADEPRRLLRVDWIPQGWGQVDPLKEALASIAEVDAGLRSRASVIAERGDDPETAFREIEAEREKHPTIAVPPNAKGGDMQAVMAHLIQRALEDEPQRRAA